MGLFGKRLANAILKHLELSISLQTWDNNREYIERGEHNNEGQN